MPTYTLNRNHTLRTVNGVLSFTKGEPTWVPPHMESDAVNIGAERLDGDAPDPLGPEVKEVAPLTESERKEMLLMAFDQIAKKNDAKDFTAQGVPTVKSVERIVDFNVEAGEIRVLWAEFKQSAEG